VSRYDLTRDELAALVADEPRYRVDQLHTGLWRELKEIGDLTTLPASLRTKLGALPQLKPALSLRRAQSADKATTRKWLFDLDDGNAIETVLMYYPRHATVCVSSQAGCAMGCTFCATGQSGYERHLRAGEIIEQVVIAMRAAQADGRRLDNVVFMGMGEPFANYDNVLAATRAIITELGIGARHLTLSTVGVVPGIRRLAEEPLQVNLAVSLHAARDELRNRLVPLNRRYPLETVIDACLHYRGRTNRRISFEWALINGVNDTARDALELAALARAVQAHVNLIALNETPGGEALGLRVPERTRVEAFRAILEEQAINVTIRRTRGTTIDAACGQLAAAEVEMKRKRGLQPST
jgi:23S rRNA (adenine2503-C2)-methyltransferase